MTRTRSHPHAGRAPYSDRVPGPRISVVTPVFDPEPALLLGAVASVLRQVGEPEHILVDDGSTRPGTAELLDRLAAWDPRVKVHRRPTNGGIAAATNDAIAAATGEYVAFLDHDDTLDAHALARLGAVLERDPALDVVYTDEAVVTSNGRVVQELRKPPWSPEYLLECNYIGHLVVVRRALLEALGGIRTGFDGSQDHDLLLRIADRTDRVAHIPEILYRWRQTATSTSATADGAAKPYALDAGKRAIGEALARKGFAATVTDRVGFGTYTARLEPEGDPEVLVLVTGADARRAVDRLRREPPTIDHVAVAVPSAAPADLDLAVADAPSADTVVVLDARARPLDPEWLATLAAWTQLPGVGMAGAVIELRDGTVVHEGLAPADSSGEAPAVSLAGLSGHIRVTRDVPAVSRGACAIDAQALRIAGGFESGYGSWDVDLARRLTAADRRIVLVTEVRVAWTGPWYTGGGAPASTVGPYYPWIHPASGVA
jgi:GT2 family glycosyltransferase